MVGKIKRVPLRDVWGNEASHFTTWLEDNIDQLSNFLGFEMTVKEREQQVGSFSLDLLAETQNGNLVVIENQLERSDHKHLGQVLTYITNINAKIAIWITSDARQEHINVINWLNEQTENQFFLIAVEAISIDDSRPAPYFSVICRPDADLRDVGIHRKELSDTGKFNIEFWTALIDQCKGRLNHFTTRTPPSYHFLPGASGKGGFTFVFLATRKFLGVELYIDVSDASANERYFNQLLKCKNNIEKEYGAKLHWDPIENKRACRVRHIIRQEDVRKSNQMDAIETLIVHMEKFEAAMRPELRRLGDQ
jgi:hypothetical protein